jgi:acetylornithine deacetylase
MADTDAPGVPGGRAPGGPEPGGVAPGGRAPGGGLEPLDALEERVLTAVAEGSDELVALARDLVALDTTARETGDPPRDEERLQRLLEARLRAAGAETDLWEPEPTGCGERHLPDRLTFEGRPQLTAGFAGRGGGRSLLLNGHIDAVSAEPKELWKSDPFAAEIRDGRIYGRGIADMKGGIAAMAFALETLRRLDVGLAGDVTFCTVTDEESSGAGGFAAVRRGVEADAGVVAEPTDFDVWVACRGSLTPTITVEGRPGHAEMRQPHWRAGGAVNAIEKMKLVLDAAERLREEWRGRPDMQHPHVSPGDIVPTVIAGGEWEVTYPASCRLVCEVIYPPGQVGEDGTARALEREITETIESAVRVDPWLREHPLRWFWDCDVVPAEVDPAHPIVTAAMGAGAAVGRAGRITGFDSWHDGATFTRAGTPTVCFGPGPAHTLHTIDEWATIDDLIDFASAAALLTMRWCGVV